MGSTRDGAYVALFTTGHRPQGRRVSHTLPKATLKQGGYNVKTSAPKQITWWIALVIGVVGIIANLVTIPVLSGFAFWLVVIAFVLLLVATVVSDL